MRTKLAGLLIVLGLSTVRGEWLTTTQVFGPDGGIECTDPTYCAMQGLIGMAWSQTDRVSLRAYGTQTPGWVRVDAKFQGQVMAKDAGTLLVAWRTACTEDQLYGGGSMGWDGAGCSPNAGFTQSYNLVPGVMTDINFAVWVIAQGQADAEVGAWVTDWGIGTLGNHASITWGQTPEPQTWITVLIALGLILALKRKGVYDNLKRTS